MAKCNRMFVNNEHAQSGSGPGRGSSIGAHSAESVPVLAVQIRKGRCRKAALLHCIPAFTALINFSMLNSHYQLLHCHSLFTFESRCRRSFSVLELTHPQPLLSSLSSPSVTAASCPFRSGVGVHVDHSSCLSTPSRAEPVFFFLVRWCSRRDDEQLTSSVVVCDPSEA